MVGGALAVWPAPRRARVRASYAAPARAAAGARLDDYSLVDRRALAPDRARRAAGEGRSERGHDSSAAALAAPRGGGARSGRALDVQSHRAGGAGRRPRSVRAGAGRDAGARDPPESPELASAGYELHGPGGTTAHLFRVAASLDSMVVGETEIQGQVRAAWRLAAEKRATGPALDELFHRALAVGKRVRRETRLGAGPLSVPSVAVELARRAFDDLSRRSVMVIGAGEMARSTAQALRYRGLSGVVVANRSLPAARALAAVGGRAIPLAAVPKALAGVDIVISSTEAPHSILSREDVEGALASSRRRPLVLIDIAVPRDLEPGSPRSRTSCSTTSTTWSDWPRPTAPDAAAKPSGPSDSSPARYAAWAPGPAVASPRRWAWGRAPPRRPAGPPNRGVPSRRRAAVYASPPASPPPQLR